MRIVIVGGAGFIGTSLARSLQRVNLRPVVLDTERRLARSAEALADIDVAAFDFVHDRNAVDLIGDASALIHLACTSNPSRSMQDIAGDAESNIAPSVRLFDAAAAAGVERVIFASSGGTVYGNPERLPVSETHTARPLSAYGISKLAIEQYLALYPQLHGVSMRIANPYGSYQLVGTSIGVIARYVVAAMSGQALEVWGDGSVIRDFIAVEDVMSAFHHALTSNSLPAGAYNIGSGVGHSINDVIEAIGRAIGKPVSARYLEARGYDVPAIILDSARFSACTSWSARIPLEEGISALCTTARMKLSGNTESHAT